ncbi:LOW QUALITY PROTEIN: hypothetical protein GX50_08055 [[Emmonsia] crescens]|uniref:Uncharacterized protein n=1 Tax=[Emmonsia] crescens TaxID=73230 RepID=A0A2B7Z847_9EURO|nr:LOW QUALITY PROTEIN: hypothetical protein GX50_08055 [Emmonsia crescens]
MPLRHIPSRTLHGALRGDAWGETLDSKQEYIILPLSQVKILKLVYKRDGDEMYMYMYPIDRSGYAGKAQHSAKNISHTSLTLAEDPIIINEPMSSTNLPCGSDQFVAIPSLQRNIERVPGGYEVYAKMSNESTDVVERGRVDQH